MEPDIEQIVFENWGDSSWTENPVWNEHESISNAISINEAICHEAPPCAEVIGVGTDSTSLSIPMDCGGEFKIDLWIIKRTVTFSIFKLGICDSEFSQNNKGLEVTINQNDEDELWYFSYFDHEADQDSIDQIRIDYDYNRWINLVLMRYSDGEWEVIWDKNSAREELINFSDEMIIADPHLWWSGTGHFDIEGLAYVDDILVTEPLNEIGRFNQ